MSLSTLVSVVIPCFNQADSLEETVFSILKSDYRNIEIVLVNDGSTDNTEEVCMSLKQKHPNFYYYNQVNSGPSVARNHAIKKANGEFILPVDGDDLIAPHYISEALKVFENDKEVKVVYCEAEKFGAKTGHWNLKPFSLANLALDNMIFVSAIYRKTEWEQCGGYPEDLRWVSEDWVFWISMLKNGGKVVKLPFVGFYYRISYGSRRKGMDNQKKKMLIAYINQNHADFTDKYLNGPLRFQRRQSKRYNTCLRFLGLLK